MDFDITLSDNFFKDIDIMLLSKFEQRMKNWSMHKLCVRKEWVAVRARCSTHPEEARVKGKKYDDSPLHVACGRSAPIQVIKELISAAPETCMWGNKDGQLPLHIVCRFHRDKENIIPVLIKESSASAITRDKSGRTPLAYIFKAIPELRKPQFALFLKTTRPYINAAPEILKDPLCNIDGELPVMYLCKYMKQSVEPQVFGDKKKKKRLASLLVLFLHPAPETSFLTFDFCTRRFGWLEKVDVNRLLIIDVVMIVVLMKYIKKYYEAYQNQSGKPGMLFHLCTQYNMASRSIKLVLTIFEHFGEDRDQILSCENEHSEFPLHTALKLPPPDHIMDSMILDMILLHPEAASRPDRHGCYPLQRAIMDKKAFNIINDLFMAFPAAVSIPYTSSQVYNGMTAALVMATKGREKQTDTSLIYLLLRADPSIVKPSEGLPEESKRP